MYLSCWVQEAEEQNDLTPITGQGWKSAVRVRMLHATVRVRIAAKKGMKNMYDHKVDGIPINQECVLSSVQRLMEGI